jgi:hypothetical protein
MGCRFVAVMTTGATANAAARALLRGGAASVDVLTFACVVGDGARVSVATGIVSPARCGRRPVSDAAGGGVERRGDRGLLRGGAASVDVLTFACVVGDGAT